MATAFPAASDVRASDPRLDVGDGVGVLHIVVLAIAEHMTDVDQAALGHGRRVMSARLFADGVGAIFARLCLLPEPFANASPRASLGDGSMEQFASIAVPIELAKNYAQEHNLGMSAD